MRSIRRREVPPRDSPRRPTLSEDRLELRPRLDLERRRAALEDAGSALALNGGQRLSEDRDKHLFIRRLTELIE